MSIYDKYQAVIGLEVHAQLLTKSKAFSADSAEYGSPPNTNVSVISLGHPGTLPKLNEEAVNYAVKLGLACHCDINRENQFARKNYFYADLPKGYQITQFDTPICKNGFINIKTEDGEKRINLTRIHLEEDAGKSIHDIDPFYSLVDLNRAGVPLVEIVSEPDMRSADEAYQYLTEVRKLVRYLEICDGNMEEGSLRCDANVSVMIKGAEQFGAKVEVKNMNSIRNVKRALEYEIKRQIEALERGETIAQDSRTFDAVTGKTATMRSKEMAHDYRYFTEPDLPPLYITQDYIDAIKAQIPPLPEELHKKYVDELQLSEYDAGVLTDDKGVVLYFEELIQHTENYKAAANWVMGPVKSFLNEKAVHIDDFPVRAQRIAQLIQLIDEDKVSYSVASQKIFPAMIEDGQQHPEQLARSMNLIQESDSDAIMQYVKDALNKYPDKVEEYRSGKKGLLGLFMGEMMKLSGGKIDPKVANQLLREALEQ